MRKPSWLIGRVLGQAGVSHPYALAMMLTNHKDAIDEPIATSMFLYGTPVTGVSYNGVELPDIESVWTDKETYPYAFVTTVCNGDAVLAWLYITANPVQIASGLSGLKIPAGGYVQYICTNNLDIFNPSIMGYNRWKASGIKSENANSFDTPDGTSWASYDVYNTDGSVYLAATEPVRNANIGLRVASYKVKYNGIELSDIETVWDKEKYPYVLMEAVYYGEYPLYVLSCYRMPFEFGVENTLVVFGYTPSQELADTIGYVANQWIASGYGEVTETLTSPTGDPVWSNHDILNTDGSVYLAATDPEPVGESATYSVTYYDGAVVQNIDEVWTDKVAEPYVLMRCTTNAAHLYISAEPFYATEGYINWVNPTTQYSFYYSRGEWEYMRKWTGDITSCHLRDTFAVWANHDVMKDGELWLSASEPIPVVGLVGNSYNGTVLPELPKLDMPYAFIKTRYNSNGGVTKVSLYSFASNAYYTLTDTGALYFGGNPSSTPNGADPVAYKLYVLSGDAWEFSVEMDDNAVRIPPKEYDEGYPHDVLTWTGFDVEYNGERYGTASEPIPVYKKE